MKRQHAEVGVKYWGNQDLLDLQTEPFKALDGFFAQYGPCIVNGCEVTSHEATFDIAPGLVVLEGVNHQQQPATMIVPFAGVVGTSLPVYLTLNHTPEVREYGDGKVKPVSYEYTAQASTLPPAEGVKHLTITATQTPRFVDVLGDDKHSFITDIERAVWNGKETTAGAQAKAEAALRSAKEYTATREAVLRTDYAAADANALRSAKSYADQIVAALVDSSPEALNTLQELAAALGNDPNFATTVMAEIGKRVTQAQVDAALAGKLSLSGGTLTGDLFVRGLNSDAMITTSGLSDTVPHAIFGTRSFDGSKMSYIRVGGKGSPTELTYHPTGDWESANAIYHSGNLPMASPSANGIMSAADKTKLDNAPMIFAAGQVTWNGGKSMSKGNVNVIYSPGSDTYTISHLANVAQYTVMLTPLNADRAVYLYSKSVGSFVVKATTLAGSGSTSGFEFCIMKYW